MEYPLFVTALAKVAPVVWLGKDWGFASDGVLQAVVVWEGPLRVDARDTPLGYRASAVKAAGTLARKTKMRFFSLGEEDRDPGVERPSIVFEAEKPSQSASVGFLDVGLLATASAVLKALEAKGTPSTAVLGERGLWLVGKRSLVGVGRMREVVGLNS